MNPDSDEGDDWTKYADTGYTSTYDPWADMVPITENEEEEEEFDDDFDDINNCDKITKATSQQPKIITKA